MATLLVFIGLLGHDTRRALRRVLTLFELGARRRSWRWTSAFLADPLSITMALFVTGVGALIHLYSIGYMHGDEGFSQASSCTSTCSPSPCSCWCWATTCCSPSWVGKGVGACSYLLISFWFTDEANAVGRQESVRHQPGGRLRAFWWPCSCRLMAVRVAPVRRASSSTWNPHGVAAEHGLGHRRVLLHGGGGRQVGPVPAAIYGCPTPWPAPPRCRLSSTPPPWLPPGVYLLTRMSPIIERGPRRGCPKSSPLGGPGHRR